MDRDLATHLRTLRAGTGLTQEELAERAGVSARTISDIERGLRTTIYRDTAGRLATSLGLSDVERTEFVAIARARTPAMPAGGPPETVPSPPSPLIGRGRELDQLLGTSSILRFGW